VDTFIEQHLSAKLGGSQSKFAGGRNETSVGDL